MRNVILHLHMSVDNVVSDPDKWMIMNDELLEESIRYYSTIDTVVFGSRTYPFLAEYWQKAEKSSASAIEKKFAKKLNGINKLVLSRSSVELVWPNSKLLNFKDIPALAKSIADLKNNKGKNISVESGIGTWRLFLEHQLFDELLLYVQPVIVGKGEKLFTDDEPKTMLYVKSTKSFDSGVLELRYGRSK
jgi:dihydrofolate reductase